MKTSEKLGLNILEETDYIRVEPLNENFEKIEQEIENIGETDGLEQRVADLEDDNKLLFTEPKFEVVETENGEDFVNVTGGGNVHIYNSTATVGDSSGYIQVGHDMAKGEYAEESSKLTNRSLKFKNYSDGSVAVEGENGISMNNEADMYGSKLYFDTLTLYNNVTENDSRAEVKMTPMAITHQEELYSDGSINTKSATWKDLLINSNNLGDTLDNIIAIQNALINGEIDDSIVTYNQMTDYVAEYVENYIDEALGGEY